MDYSQALQLLGQLSSMIEHETIKRDLNAIAHKLRYPMTAILDRVEGDGVIAKAHAVGVSRQMVYVWMSEKARPNAAQARIISKLTGIPVECIRADGFKEGQGATGRKRATARGKLAKDGKGVPAGAAGQRTKRARVAGKQDLGGSPRTVRKRTRLRRGDTVRAGA